MMKSFDEMYAKDEDESTEDSSEESQEEFVTQKATNPSTDSSDGLLLFRFMDEIE